ncbi:MAG: hypothetical protein MJZ60_07385 [Bacteroidaceae bacterium]|nr:hypothetical protein [Bacteroidaceae bacterium]
MKKTTKNLLALVAGTMALAACSDDAIVENNPQQPEVARKHITLTAVQEENGATRAAISSEDSKQIVWTAGDKFTVLYRDANTLLGFDNVDFSLTGGANTSSGTFTGSVLESVTDETVYTALYPRYAKNEEQFNMTWDKLSDEERGTYKAFCEFQEEDCYNDAVNDIIKMEDFNAIYNFLYVDKPWEELSQKQQELYNQYVRFNFDYLNVSLDVYYITQEEYDHILAYVNGGSTTANHSITLTDDGKVTDIVFPAIQTATEGSFDPAAGLMMAQAVGEASALEFKNVASYFKFVAPFDCRSVSIFDNAHAGNMAGTLTLDYNAGEPTAEVTANGTSSITLTGTIEEGKTYYIATLPQTFTEGIMMVFSKTDGTDYVKRTSSSYTLGRNKVSNMGTPALGDENVINPPYVTFSAASTQTLTMSKAVEGMEYSVGGGAWSTLGTTTVTFGNGDDLRLRGSNGWGTAKSTSDHSTITFGNDAPVACSGDIRTLVDFTSYETTSTANARFCELFCYCSQLTSAPALPATTLAENCYDSMFQSCSNLTTAPALPATTLANGCYQLMFLDCTSLTTAPALPATTLAGFCYNGMFYGCTSLTTAPETLPATTLAGSCYSGMFNGCTSLTTAPETLPATTLENHCYIGMFNGCTSLETAPELPATTLVEGCYVGMFSGCSNLNYVKAAFTTNPTTFLTGGWLSGVAATGTLVINPAALWYVIKGPDSVPEGWTVEQPSGINDLKEGEGI